MIKIKHLIAFCLFAIFIYACGSNNDTTSFDHEAQALIDNDSLISFLQKHYYNNTIDSIKPLVSGETALIDDSRLVTQNVTETINGTAIDFKLYTLVVEEGEDPNEKGKPTIFDFSLIDYEGRVIENTDSISNSFDANSSWFVLGGGTLDNITVFSPIMGFPYGISNFKAGENNSTEGQPITFSGSGKGVLFIPSGLAYRNTATSTIPANSILLFYVKLFDIVQDTDTDQDGIASINEDPDGDGNPRNDDTDGDGVPNYVDTDDDGDGKTTINEDTNGNGNPADDFNDPNNPSLPDYLNSLFFGGD